MSEQKIKKYYKNLRKIIMLNQKTIQELQQILKEDYEKEKTEEEVFKIANDLISYFDLLVKINHQNKSRINEKNNG